MCHAKAFRFHPLYLQMFSLAFLLKSTSQKAAFQWSLMTAYPIIINIEKSFDFFFLIFIKSIIITMGRKMSADPQENETMKQKKDTTLLWILHGNNNRYGEKEKKENGT